MAEEDYLFREAREEEMNDVISLISEHFVPEATLIRSYMLNLENKDPSRLHEFLKFKSELAVLMISQMTSIVAIHKSSNKSVGHLGLLIHENKAQKDAVISSSEEKSSLSGFKILSEFQYHLSTLTKKSDLYDCFPNATKLTRLGILAVHRNHRKRGLSEKLLRKGLEWAKLNGSEVAHGTFTSWVSERVADKVGLATVKEYDLRDPKDSSGSPIFAIVDQNNLVSVKASFLTDI
ncbi:hypothetical protein QAD02_019336 [Eretmocerus hayati]|uniref:Uncharacterized protein n=1 Tax=Eretmocerus hayati TaxID=131215 RepID=A0ACC2PIY5_9HYME|nr:hypothetical protein QAD02_019336 [Eretmocerus hayati]